MAFSTLFLDSASGGTLGGIKDMVSDLSQTIGVDLFEEDIDNVVFQTNELLCNQDFIGSDGPFWWLPLPILQNTILVAVNQLFINSCLAIQNQRGTKTGQNHGKNKVKNTSLEISLVEYLCFVCKGTNLSLEKRGEIPISLIHNSFSYHCTPNVVIANGFDLKRLGLRKMGVKFCFALCWTFSKTRTGNRTKDLPPLLSNTWFCECLNDRHLKMLKFK